MDSRRTKIAGVLLIASVGLLGMGCFERTLRPVNPCTRSNVGETIRVESVDKVDLLFMIDNSNSMSQEQAALTAELPRMVQILASGNNDADPEQDFQPVASMHIGIITSDMGTGGFAVPTCDRGTLGTMFGDDGILITRGRTAIAGCMATYPAVFDFVAETTEPNEFAARVACVATTGTGGCGFEQQLEAVLKAVSPSVPQEWTREGYMPPVFFANTYGHADTDNAGFIRGDSALAIIMVTDEEDCSAANPEIFNSTTTEFPGDLNLRCWMHEEATNHPIERYVGGTAGTTAGLINLRENPGLLIFAGIIGVPVDSVTPGTGTPDFEGMLNHPDMQNVIDPMAPATAPRLRPSCIVPNVGEAYPPRRIVRVAQGLSAMGASVTIQSICQTNGDGDADYSGAINTIIEKIADALGGACLPRDLNPDAEGLVGCEVFEILEAGTEATCETLEGRTATPEGTTLVEGVSRTICAVTQVGPAGAAADEKGWFYETAEAMIPGSDIAELCGDTGQRIRFTIDPETNSDIRLECLQTIAPTTGTDVGIGTFCNPDPAAPATENLCPSGRAPAGAEFPLTCDPAVRTCGVACPSGETSECTAAGLLGDVCDTRTYLEALGEGNVPVGVDANAPRNFCVNPTCL